MEEEESESSKSPDPLIARQQRLDRYYGKFRAHLDPSLAIGTRGGNSDKIDMMKRQSDRLFTSSTEVKLMKVEFEVFNGIFYNLDAQDDAAYQYEEIDELYEFYEEIGQGAFNVVYRAKFKPWDKIMAVKILRDDRSTQVQ